MCVAVVVLTDEGPTDREMRQMYVQNDDGCGLSWRVGQELFYVKGLDVKEAIEVLQDAPRPTLLHFRYATHGGKAKHLTHPFPLGEEALLSTELQGLAPAVMMHNGTWSDYRKYLPEGLDAKTVSDTAVAAYVAEEHEAILDEVSWATAVARVTPEGKVQVRLRGRWSWHQGNLYSNLYWKNNYVYEGSSK
jgi:predicted glutamine amidotransferase